MKSSNRVWNLVITLLFFCGSKQQVLVAEDIHDGNPASFTSVQRSTFDRKPLRRYAQRMQVANLEIRCRANEISRQEEIDERQRRLDRSHELDQFAATSRDRRQRRANRSAQLDRIRLQGRIELESRMNELRHAAESEVRRFRTERAAQDRAFLDNLKRKVDESIRQRAERETKEDHTAGSSRRTTQLSSRAQERAEDVVTDNSIASGPSQEFISPSATMTPVETHASDPVVTRDMASISARVASIPGGTAVQVYDGPIRPLPRPQFGRQRIRSCIDESSKAALATLATAGTVAGCTATATPLTARWCWAGVVGLAGLTAKQWHSAIEACGPYEDHRPTSRGGSIGYWSGRPK